MRRARVGGKGNAVTREPLASMSDTLESLEANQSNPQTKTPKTPSPLAVKRKSPWTSPESNQRNQRLFLTEESDLSRKIPRVSGCLWENDCKRLPGRAEDYGDAAAVARGVSGDHLSAACGDPLPRARCAGGDGGDVKADAAARFRPPALRLRCKPRLVHPRSTAFPIVPIAIASSAPLLQAAIVLIAVVIVPVIRS